MAHTGCIIAPGAGNDVGRIGTSQDAQRQAASMSRKDCERKAEKFLS
jgi:hypothetical protein